MFNYKPYRFTKGEDPALDAQFSSAPAFGKIRTGDTVLFWKSGLRWHMIPLDGIRRIFRRVETVHGRLCCGGKTYIIQWLVLILPDGSELVLHVSDDIEIGSGPRDAEVLLEHLKTAHPKIQSGKV